VAQGTKARYLKSIFGRVSISAKTKKVSSTKGSKIMSNTAIRQEVERVKKLKRALESEVELLRSDMEKGKVHIRVSNDKEFRDKVARCVVDEAHPGYHGTGFSYADPVEGRVYYKERNAAWNPWSDSINWRIVSVDDLVNQDNNNDFSPTVDWNCADIPYRDMVADYLEAEGEKFESNGDIPEWVSRDDVIAFARDNGWDGLIEGEEEAAMDSAVQFALDEFKDEIVIDIVP
jgi:hypothetical protein